MTSAGSLSALSKEPDLQMAGLPEGLVTTNESTIGEIKSFDNVDVADFFRLWRAYSTSKKILVNGSGRRLENFFWRILSNERIWKNITCSQVTILLGAIDEEGPLRTTPTQSPRDNKDESERTPTPASPLTTHRPRTLSSGSIVSLDTVTSASGEEAVKGDSNRRVRLLEPAAGREGRVRPESGRRPVKILSSATCKRRK